MRADGNHFFVNSFVSAKKNAATRTSRPFVAFVPTAAFRCVGSSYFVFLQVSWNFMVFSSLPSADLATIVTSRVMLPLEYL